MLLLLKVLLTSAVVLVCSGETFDELSEQIKFLFKVYDYKQKEILEKITEISRNIGNIDATSGTCSGSVNDLKSKVEDLEETFKEFCTGSSESLADFSEVLRSDECTEGIHNCDVNAKCTDLLLGFKCECNEGFSGDGQSCNDVNECTQRSRNCHRNAVCTNLMGSYSCECNPNYYGNGRTCTERRRCQSNSDCSSSSQCQVLGGNRYCFCKDGYRGNGITCTDVDECAEGQFHCDKNAACKNAPGTYSCICNHGFKGNGKTCADVNECLGVNDCHPDATCSNRYGSYSCSCNSGYRGDGKTCEDVDECEEELFECQPNSSCNNIRGSYSCICDPGYHSDGYTCEDNDECSSGHECHSDAMCSNIVGSYKCSCNTGHRGDGYECEDMCPFERVSDVGCIFFEHSVKRSWTDARDNCQDEGGRLLSVDSPHSFSKLQQYLVESMPITIPEWTGLWVGVDKGTWLGGRPVSSEEWTTEYCPGSGECCGYLLSSSKSFTLNNDPCDWTKISICQWNETVY